MKTFNRIGEESNKRLFSIIFVEIREKLWIQLDKRLTNQLKNQIHDELDNKLWYKIYNSF